MVEVQKDLQHDNRGPSHKSLRIRSENSITPFVVNVPLVGSTEVKQNGDPRTVSTNKASLVSPVPPRVTRWTTLPTLDIVGSNSGPETKEYHG